ncbi:MAG: nucleoside triphosphate pyrophosphohydrolase [Acidimicrobiia bacterium]
MTLPTVVVAGLGPAGPEHVTAAVTEAIARIPHRYLRTCRHPSASVVAGATTFDHVYEDADTFDDVYRRITDALVAAAVEHGEILYAVPGSPLVLERTVRHLRDDRRVRCVVLPALSFLDLAYDRLGIDPVENGLRLVDGHEFATAAAGERGPLLVAHCHANWVLSEIKLAVEDATGDEPVVLLQRLGCPDEAVVHTTWAELDRTVEADHLTSLYIPSLGAPVGSELVRFHELIRRLRAECPWDREQTHASLARYAIEETYELVEAIGALGGSDSGGGDGDGDDELVGELGDVLLQVELHAAIGDEEGRFSLGDDARAISEKMIRRHPHVFGDVEVDGASDVARNWVTIKAAEKDIASADRSESSATSRPAASTFDGIAGSLPSLLYARELGAAAAKRGFDWDDPRGTLEKVAEELREVTEAFDDPAAVHDELGDLLFAVVNVARHRRVDPEVALRQAARKFRVRVAGMERLAVERGIETETCGLAVLDQLWDEVKRTSG